MQSSVNTLLISSHLGLLVESAIVLPIYLPQLSSRDAKKDYTRRLSRELITSVIKYSLIYRMKELYYFIIRRLIDDFISNQTKFDFY